jgi:hypothetical protein
MAYTDPGQEIQRRASSLAMTVNAALSAHYRKNKTDASKQLSVSVSTNTAGLVRTPEEQAKEILDNQSWTCNGSHMTDAARHLLIKQGGQTTWQLKSLESNYKDAWNVLVNAWSNAMQTQDLRNHAKGRAFQPFGGDALHIELPDSRLLDTDARVTRCLEAYAKATRLEGKAKNMRYETTDGSKYQRDWLASYDANLAKQKAKGP